MIGLAKAMVPTKNPYKDRQLSGALHRQHYSYLSSRLRLNFQHTHIATIACLVLILLIACSSRDSENLPPIQWNELVEAKDLASEPGKKILVYFRADW